MSELFIAALLGHLVGDYLFQTKNMALMKGLPGPEGFGACFAHVFTYTFFVALFTNIWSPLFFILVFLPHYIIDHWSLATPWLKMIHGRTFEKAEAATEHREWDIAFTAIVYTVTDNTMHLICLWLALKYMGY